MTVLFPTGARYFCPAQGSDRLWGHRISYPMVTGGRFPWGKGQCEDEHAMMVTSGGLRQGREIFIFCNSGRAAQFGKAM
jgi:hypothetical protein